MSDTDFLPCQWQRATSMAHVKACDYPLPSSAPVRRVVNHGCCTACPVREERSARERILDRLGFSPFVRVSVADVATIVREELPE